MKFMLPLSVWLYNINVVTGRMVAIGGQGLMLYNDISEHPFSKANLDKQNN